MLPVPSVDEAAFDWLPRRVDDVSWVKFPVDDTGVLPVPVADGSAVDKL